MGKGFFDIENKVWQFLNKMTDLILLGILAFLFSIPIVTAGAATCGFFYGAMKLYEDTDSGIWADFWHGFRSSFRNATLLWLLQCAAVALLLLNIWIGLRMSSPAAVALIAPSIVLLAMTLIVSFFAFPISARYSFGFGKIIRDAVLFALRFLPHGLALLAIAVLGVVAVVYVPYITVLIPPVVGYQISRVNVWVFQKLESSEQHKDKE